MPPDSLLLTKHEAAKALGIGRDALLGLIAAGEIGIVPIGGDERVPSVELERWVRNNTRWRERCRSGDDQAAPGSSTSDGKASATARPSPARPQGEPSRPWNASSSTTSPKAATGRVHRLRSKTS